MLNPNGRKPGYGVTSLSDGLIGFFPCETPLVNIVTPTYITDNASEDITTYNYAIDRTANPSMITDIKGKMRWINKSKAIKGTVGTKMTGNYRQLPSLISEGYGCENDFSVTAIVNKHGNNSLPCAGSSSMYFPFTNTETNNQECLMVLVGDDEIGIRYGEVDTYGNIIDPKTNIAISTSLQIECIYVNIKRTDFYEYQLSVTDSLGNKILSQKVENVRFSTIIRFKNSNKHEFTNIRTYSRKLTSDEHIEICKTGDCKSKYYVYSNSFSVGYDMSTKELKAVSNSPQDKYPLGTLRVFSKAGFAVNDGSRGYDGLLGGVDGLGEYSSYNSSTIINNNVSNKKTIYVDNIPSYIDIDNTDNSFFITDSNINSSSEMKASLLTAEFYSEFISGNRSIFFGLVHHGYIFVEHDTGREYLNKVVCDSSMGVGTYLKYGTKVLAPNELIVHNGSSDEVMSLKINPGQLTGYNYRVYGAKLGGTAVYQAITGTLPISKSTYNINITPAYSNSSILVQVYNSSGTIVFIKNIEFRTQAILNISTPLSFSNYKDSYSAFSNRNPVVQGSTVNRLQNNRGKNDMSLYDGIGYSTFYTKAKTSYNGNNDMIVEFNTDMYNLSEFQTNLLTIYEECITSGALLNRSIVEKKVGTCTGITYIYNEYMNENYSDTTVITSGEVTVTGYNPIDLLTSKSNGRVSIGQVPGNKRSLKIVFGQNFASSPDLSSYSVGQYVSGFTQLDAKSIKISQDGGTNYYICFDGDNFYRIAISGSYVVTKEMFSERTSVSSPYDVLNQIPSSKETSIFGMYELIITKEINTASSTSNYISINSCDGSREYKLDNPILTLDTYAVNTEINMPFLFEMSEIENIGVIGTRQDIVFSKVRASISNYIYFLPKPTIFMFTSSSIDAYNNTSAGQKHNSFINKSYMWSEQSYIEKDYNFEDTASVITLSYTYGINRFLYTSNMIKDGYAWFNNDIIDANPDNDNFYISIDKDENQTMICQLSSGAKSTAKIIYSLEHLKSDKTSRYTPSFDVSSLKFDDENKCKLMLRLRHPVSKRCLETPITIYNNIGVDDILQSTEFIKNDNTINYLTYADCMWDFDFNSITPVNNIIKDINSTKKILLLYGTNSRMVHCNNIEQSAMVKVTGTGFSIFKVMKKTKKLPRLYFQKECYDLIYKPNELKEFCLNSKIPSLFTSSSFPLSDFYDHNYVGNCSYYGIDTDYNWGKSSFNIIPSENIMNQCILDSTTFDYIPSLYLDDTWNVQTFPSDIENDLYELFECIAYGGYSEYYRYENEYSKSFVCRIEVDENVTMKTQVSETEFTINCVTGTDFSVVSHAGITSKGTHFGNIIFNTDELRGESYIISSHTEYLPQYTVFATVTIPSFLKPTSVYKSKENQYKISKSNNEFSYVKNRLDYTISDKSVAHTFQVTEDFDATDKFLIKNYTTDDNWHIIDIKRSLGSIITTRTKTPKFSTYYGIGGWLTNNPVSITPVGATVYLSAENLKWDIKDMTYVISKQEDRAISQGMVESMFSIYGLDDNYYGLVIDGALYSKDSPQTRITNSNTTYSVYIISLDKNLDVILGGMFYARGFQTSIKIEIIPYYEEEIKIVYSNIHYNKKIIEGDNITTNITTNIYAITPSSKNFIKSGNGNIPLSKEELTNENNISSLMFEDTYDTSYFGNDFIIKRTEIPYNNVEILSKVPNSCIDFYDFYGKNYKYYNKINLLEQATITECDVIEKHRIGIYSKEILTNTIKKQLEDIKQIVFLVKYDELNIFNKTDDTFSISAITDAGALSFTFMTDTILNKDDKWQLIKISLSNYDRYSVYRYNDSTLLWELILPENIIQDIGMNSFKLSIRNNRWLFAGLMIDTSFDVSYTERILGRIENEKNISLSNNEYLIPDGSYFYYNENPLYDVKKSDCSTKYSSSSLSTRLDFKYGKFQEIVNRQTSSSDLILRDIVVSYRNIPNNKLISTNEKLIGEDATSVSFDIYCQKLGVNELNNPVIFLDYSLNILKVPTDNVIYVGCLVDDESDDAILVQQYTEKLIFTYNSFLPTTGYVYEEGSLAILGREVVAIKRLWPTVITHDNKKYVVLEIDRDYMNTSMSFNQKLPVKHFTGENIRSVYDFSSNVTSYEFVDSMCDGENNVFNISRTGGNCVLKEEIYKFNKFTTLSGKYEIDKGCAMYLFEGSSDNTLLQSTMFIENISTDPKESEINISLKNKMDMIYDYNIINYKTLENTSILTAIKEIVFPYINVKENDNIILSSATYSIKDTIENIKTMELSSYTSVGEALDAICNCGYNIWIDENERFVIDTDIYSKQIHNGIRVEYDNGLTSMNKITVSGINHYGYSDCCNIDINGYNSLTDDFVISERDSLIVNKIDIDHENTVPMYERTEYVVGDRIYPINCLKIMSNVKYENYSPIVYLDKNNAVKPMVQEFSLLNAEFNSTKSKIGVMCVIRRGDYELQYKMIKAERES